MAINAATVWEVRQDGADTNGGGFKSGASGTDRSQQAAAHATLTTASTVHTTTTQINVAVGDYTVTAADVGNLLQITGGTATAGFYEITVADTVNNRWQVDRAVGTAGQTVAGAMGGAVATPGKIGGVAVQYNIIFIKYSATPYSITSASTNAAAGCLNAANDTVWCGYDTTRALTNTDANRPTLQINVASATVFTGVGMGTVLNLILDGNSQTASRGDYSRFMMFRVKCINMVGIAFDDNGSSGAKWWLECEATSCASSSFRSGRAIRCYAYDNTATAFDSVQAAIDCIADSNSGGSTVGFANPLSAIGCVAYNNGSHGFLVSTNAIDVVWAACVAEANGGWGFSRSAANATVIGLNCAAYNNTSGAFNQITGPITAYASNIGAITVTDGSVFTDAAGADFTLNATANRGALLRAGAYGAFPGSNTSTYRDIGAAQHQDSGSGGGLMTHPGMLGGMRG